MTSYGSEQLAVRALAAGAASYVPKSALKEDLQRTVKQVLELTSARRGDEKILEHLRVLRYADDTVRTHVAMALMEALSNAMIHGNLEISSAMRRAHPDEYHALARSRRTMEPFASRRVHLEALQSPEQVRYVVRDEGPGFDPSVLPDPTLPENMTRASGRGVLLIRAFMDRVEYTPEGNQITMTRTARRS
jgi:anti-sigma regulatory factor (Ser/Thr protein kinase)